MRVAASGAGEAPAGPRKACGAALQGAVARAEAARAAEARAAARAVEAWEAAGMEVEDSAVVIAASAGRMEASAVMAEVEWARVMSVAEGQEAGLQAEERAEERNRPPAKPPEATPPARQARRKQLLHSPWSSEPAEGASLPLLPPLQTPFEPRRLHAHLQVAPPH